MPKPGVHMLRRAEFAQFAEALGVDTNTIMGAHTDDDGKTWRVSYTPDGFENEDPVMLGTLWVNPEGIMEVVSRDTIATVGAWKREVEKLMRKMAEEN